MTSKEKCITICKLLSQKKAGDILYIDVAEKTPLCDYFLVCSGRSSTQVRALAEHVEEKLEKDFGELPRRKEGVREGRWAVIDYADVIVHIFNDEERDFYNLERLWEDGKNMTRYRD